MDASFQIQTKVIIFFGFGNLTLLLSIVVWRMMGGRQITRFGHSFGLFLMHANFQMNCSDVIFFQRVGHLAFFLISPRRKLFAESSSDGPWSSFGGESIVVLLFWLFYSFLSPLFVLLMGIQFPCRSLICQTVSATLDGSLVDDVAAQKEMEFCGICHIVFNSSLDHVHLYEWKTSSRPPATTSLSLRLPL